MKLYDYQQKIVDTAPDRCGLFMDCGLGKSAVSLCLSKKHNYNGKTLVITTKSLKRNWLNEISLWWPEGSDRIRVLSKEEFKKYHKTLDYYDAVIFDEAHYAAYSTNQIHKAMWLYISHHNPKFIWLATATPTLANVMSVWGLSRLIGNPLGNYFSFKMKYFKQVPMGFRKIFIQKRNIHQDIAIDLKKIGVVLSKEEAIDLPETVHEFEYFELTSEQKRAIKDLDNLPNTTVPLTYANYCLQISNGTLKTDDSYTEIKCEKIKRLLDLIEQFPQSVVVCRQTAELELLKSKIPNSRIYNGQTKPEERDEIIRLANNRECTMLLQTECAVGFSLTTDIIIFYSHSWSYTSYYQTFNRNGGLRQKGKNTHIHLITEKSADEDVWKCLDNKNDFDIALYQR